MVDTGCPVIVHTVESKAYKERCARMYAHTHTRVNPRLTDSVNKVRTT
jgi:hypothetical protein